MLKINKFILGQLQTNCYIISSSKNNCYIIDPADDFVFLSDYITNHHLNPKAIILTHGHFDHCLAALPLKMIYSIPIMANSQDLFLLKNIDKSANYWTNQNFSNLPITQIDIKLDKIKPFFFDQNLIKIINTPGHTPGSVSIYIKSTNALFTGDLVFKDGIGRTDLSYSNPSDLFSSLKKITKLPPQTIIYPGHGSKTSLSDFF